MFSLRPYQAEAKQAILSAWDEGHRKTLLVLPTGCGKTVVFSSVTEEQVGKGHRVLIMAHRGELLEQAAQKLKDASGLDTVLEKAESSSLGSFIPVTVGSVQSLCQPSRLSRFPEDYYQDIIVDEAHHCLSDSYRRVLDHFPEANILGVTATPDRGDMKNLGEFFDSRAYEYSMSAAIKDGYLCPIKAQMIPLELDISSVKMSSGDFAAGEIGSALEPYLHQIADEMVRYCGGRRTVVFLPLIATSQRFCRMLNDRGLRAAEVAKWHKEGVGKFSKELPSRVVNNLACCFAGLKLIESLCARAGLSFSDVFPFGFDACIRYLEHGAKEYLLDGGTNNQSVVEQTFEIMARMGLDGKTEYNLSDDKTKLFIRLSQVYDKYTKYRKDYAIVGEVLTYAQFKKQLMHSDVFLQHNVQHKFNGKNCKCWVINYQTLLEHCDVSGFDTEDGDEVKPLN